MPIDRAWAVFARPRRSSCMTLDNLVSKVTAAGLAAGLFLLWWPTHLPSTGMQWLVLRGLAWTLVFEVLVLSFVPLETLAARGLKRRRGPRPAQTMRRRLAAAPAPARTGGAVLLACAGLVAPGMLLLHAGRPPATPVAHTTKVVRKVVVRKVVREKTVVVRAAAPPPAYAPAPAAQAPAPAPAAKRKPAAETKKTATAKQAAPATKQAAPKTTTAPTTSTTPASDPSALPDPAQQATAPAAESSATSAAGQAG